MLISKREGESVYKKRANTWFEYADFVFLEILCVIVSFALAYIVRYGSDLASYTELNYTVLVCAIVSFDICVAVFFNSFGSVLRRGYYKEFMASMRHVIMVFAGVTLFLFTVQESATYSRIVIFLTFGFDFVLSYISRLIYKKTRKARVTHQRSILVIAPASEFGKITDGFGKDLDNGIVICGYVDATGVFSGEIESEYKIVASPENVVEYACREWVDEVIIKMDSLSNADQKILISKFIEMGVTVHTVLDGFETPDGQQMVETVAGMTVVTSSIKTTTAGELLVKRLMDVVGGLIGCILTILIGIIIAPFILIKSPGHLIFRQTRIGMNGKKFKMLKFRSMVNNAEAQKSGLLDQNTVSNNMMFKLDWDPRVIGNRITKDGKKKTGIGEFIRKTSIDELPQFFNVLLGNMSLVGTRPPTVDEWEKYELHHRARLAVRPGITGMWQVSGRSDITDFEEVVKLDTEYIYNWSIGLDLRILVKTIGAVFKRKGAK